MTQTNQTDGELKTFTKEVRSIYDFSNEFYTLFLDPSMLYSTGVFASPDDTLEDAQMRKLDEGFERANIQRGQTVLDVGFGWGAAVRRLADKYGCRAIGLTLSQAQHDYVQQTLVDRPLGDGEVDLRIQGWEQFNEPVDAIVSFEVMEHFRHERYQAFFDRCFEVLPSGGRALIQVNAWTDAEEFEASGKEITHEQVMFAKFIRKEIFPHAMLPQPSQVRRHAEQAGFKTVNHVSLREHYVPTLDTWAENLEANKERAIELVGQKKYDDYIHYLTGCSKNFGSGHIDVPQFTFEKP